MAESLVGEEVTFTKPPFGTMTGRVVEELDDCLRVQVQNPGRIEGERFFRVNTSGAQKDKFEVVA